MVQQLTNYPGNFMLLVRFFSASRQGLSVLVGVWSVVAALGMLVQGPAEVMNSVLGGAPAHAAADVVVSVVVVVNGTAATVIAARQRNLSAASLAVLGLVGCIVTGVSATRVTGQVFGYLIIWAVALPVAALISLGMLHAPAGQRGSAPFRLALCAGALVICALATVQAAAVPPLCAVSDPEVGQLAPIPFS